MKKIKPLLLLLPFAIILGILPIIDDPIPEQHEDYGTESESGTIGVVTNEDTEDTDDTNAGDTEVTVYVDDGQDTNRKLTLIVGKTGNCQDKNLYEPIYEEPDYSSEEIAKLQYNCAVFPTEEQDDEDFYRVDLEGKGIGYVSKEGADKIQISYESGDPRRNKILDDCLKYIGLEFKYKGECNLQVGLDCSRYVSEIYKLSGYDVPNKPIALRDYGREVPVTKVQPADLVFYDKANKGSGHVALYLGDGFVINSAGHSGRKYPEGGVRISKVMYLDRTSYQYYDLLDVNESFDAEATENAEYEYEYEDEDNYDEGEDE